MRVAIIYDSHTGTTRAAAEAMGQHLRELGNEVHIDSVVDADPTVVSQADLICVGSWTQGLFVILQHATKATMQFIERLGDLAGKKAIVFCTYKLATGSLLPTMAQALRAKGAEVVGEYKFRGPAPTQDFQSYAASGLSSA
ncbi:MAG: hypothetical protein GY711_02705 [bacterium]|nr:hypothetical protein [bacterium]